MKNEPSQLQPESARDPQTAKAAGICATCNHAGTCLFLRAARRPVWHCDEFDGAQASAPAAAAPPPGLASASHSPAELAELGLCADCESRQGCAHRRAGTPVYTCDDYR